jgi:hypothetical protein
MFNLLLAAWQSWGAWQMDNCPVCGRTKRRKKNCNYKGQTASPGICPTALEEIGDWCTDGKGSITGVILCAIHGLFTCVVASTVVVVDGRASCAVA